MRKLAQYKLECPAEEILGQKLYAPIPIAKQQASQMLHQDETIARLCALVHPSPQLLLEQLHTVARSSVAMQIWGGA